MPGGGPVGHERLAGPIDAAAVQELLDSLSGVTGLSVQMRDSRGFLVPGGKEALALCELTRGSRDGFDPCRRQAVAHCPRVVGETREYKVHRIFHHIAAPIRSREQLAGIFVAGPFLRAPYSEDALGSVAVRLGLPIDQVLGGAREVPLLSDVQIEKARKFLSSLSTFVSAQVTLQETSGNAQADKARLEAVISGMVDGVAVFDRDGRVTAVNRAGQEILGRRRGPTSPYRPGSGLTSPASDAYPVDVLPLARVFNEGVSVVNAETSFRYGDGEIRTCLISAAPIHNSEGTITGAVAVFRDVTILKEVERLKDEIVSVVSHEFRSPLTAISGYTQMLIRQLSKKEGMEKELGEANLVLAQTQRLTTMVSDLLDISCLASGQFVLDKHSVSLPALVNAVADRLRGLSEAHTITVRAPKHLPPVYADADRIEQVLGKLIDNAIKYSPGGGQVLVTVKPNGDEARVSVQDWGIGIERKNVSKVFDRFYRVDNRESREYEGIGLGLHVTRLLVEAHNGHIWASSRKGRGSIFSFSLPLSGRNGETGGNVEKSSHS